MCFVFPLKLFWIFKGTFSDPIMEYLSVLIPLMCSILSLGIFLTGITLAIFEISELLLAVISTSLGLIGLFVSAALWISTPKCLQSGRSLQRKPDPHFPKFARGSRDKTLEMLPEHNHLITPDTTEALMKSIRGIPYLIQVGTK